MIPELYGAHIQFKVRFSHKPCIGNGGIKIETNNLLAECIAMAATGEEMIRKLIAVIDEIVDSDGEVEDADYIS